jgi:hypothetical protein
MTFEFSQVKHMQNVEKKVLFLEEENPLLKEQYCFHPEVIQEEQKCSKSETLTQVSCGTHCSKDKVQVILCTACLIM